MPSRGSTAAAPFAVDVALTGDADETGRVPLAFTATGGVAPGIWSPAFGSPRPRPVIPDGPHRWRLEVRLPYDADASWAAVPDVRALVPSPADRLRALVSPRARVAIGTRMDARFVAADPVAPSLYRLIGAPPDAPLTPNIGLIPTPGAAALDGRALCTPMRDESWRVVRGHRLVRREAAPDTSPGRDGDHDDAPDSGAGTGLGRRHGGNALLLDGEVLRRLDDALAETHLSRTYLDNRGAAERFVDHARPLRFARSLAPLIAEAGDPPSVVVGVSAAAPSALALGLLLGAPFIVLLSPAFIDERTHRRLVGDAAAHGAHLDVRAGREEHGDGDPRRSLHDRASRFAAAVREAGGDARFTSFSGGHDLPAWRVALLDALHAAGSFHP